ncbi:hypothetical protein SEPCBS119000_002481 [Sporothrix epigloea]|uniref:PH domain-containing protein n=1 Tax=Sporothrix epigloea TaxID=1892477 RepID=A0ABP0DI33_9PEZI
MTAVTDAPASKPLRYRTIRGKNVPASRRPVEPTQTELTSTSSSDSVSTPHSRTSAGTTNSSSNGSGKSDLPSRRPASRSTSESVCGGDGPLVSAKGCQYDANNAHGAMNWNMADAVQQVQSSQRHYQQQALIAATTASPFSDCLQKRPPPLRPTRLDTSMPAHSPAQRSPYALSPVAGDAAHLVAPILVPLPSARARGGALDADEVARRDAEADRLLAEQKRKDLERLERELANHQSASANLPPKSPSREKFSFLTLRRGLSSSAPPTPTTLPQSSPEQPPSIPVSPISPAGEYYRPATSYTNSRTHTGSEHPPTTSPASAVSPMDVSSSAPGHGADRPIIIRCQQFTATVNFTPKTTAADMLHAAADLLPRHIDFTGCALIESYTRLSLERRLRQYERIRDIHTSWDSSSDNFFSILLSEPSAVALTGNGTSPREIKSLTLKSGSSAGLTDTLASTSVGRYGIASDLELSAVSCSRTTPPPGFTYLSIYHSQKPGRWNKRFVTLVPETGQLIISKKADKSRAGSLSVEAKRNAKNSADGDVQSLCHLSDYDIYTPTKTQLRKHLRPPKSHCFAIKSQQRTTVFLNTDNYVHFISTDDPDVAQLFYSRVFAWRSWYLVNRQLALPRTKNATASPPKQTPSVPPSSSGTLRNNFPQRTLSRRSADDTPQHDSARISTAGSLFGTIGDLDLTLTINRTGQSKPSAASSGPVDRTLSLRAAAEPPSTFAPGGLLGVGYDKLKRAEIANNNTSDGQHRHQPKENVTAAAAAAAASSSVPSASNRLARQRSKSVRGTAATSVSRTGPSSDDDIPLGLQFPQYAQLAEKRSEREVGLSRCQSVGRSAAKAVAAQAPAMPPKVPAIPAPLIDLTPKFQEAPQWSKEGKGHGVRAPAGTTHLVDLATDWNSHLPGNGSRTAGGAILPPSNSNLFRRDQASNVSANQNLPGSSSKRSQTMTASSAAAAAAFSRTRSLAHHARPPHV